MVSEDKMKYYKQVTEAITISNAAQPAPFNANFRLVCTGIDRSSLGKILVG